MNTNLRFLVCLLWLLPFKGMLNAQATYQAGILPSLNLNLKLKNNWSLNTRVESRQLIQRGEVDGPSEQKYQYVLTDISAIAAKKVGLNARLAAGYLLRIEDGALIHRFIQQYIVVQRLRGFRLAHRLVTDQTFSEAEKPDFRIRYRLSSEIPLNGEAVDQGEFYLKINNEYLNSWQAREHDLEIRLVPLLGYDLNSRTKIETGLDYRVNRFLYRPARHSYWMCFNLFVEI